MQEVTVLELRKKAPSPAGEGWGEENKINYLIPLIFWVMISIVPFGSVHAAVREGGGSAKIVNKLQTMVKEITAERDQLKSGNDKLTAELEQLKKDLAKLREENTAAASAEAKLSGELTAQKSSADELRGRLDNTTAKLHEVIDKYNALNKSKNELSAEHAALQNNQKFTSSELKQCESKNIKLYEGAKDVIEGYQSCRNRGIMDALIESEPVLQINNVEFETIVQEYEDKLNKQKYQGKSITDAAKNNGGSLKE